MSDAILDSTQHVEARWPDAQGRPIVFLLDAASSLEERILRDWVERNCPEGVALRDVGIVPVASTRRPWRNRTSRELEPILSTSDDPLLAPLRLLWMPPPREQNRPPSAIDVLRLGDARDPGWLRERWLHAFAPTRLRVVAAEPAPVSELRARWRDASGNNLAETMGLAAFVARQAALALDRAERRSLDARYKVPRFVHEEILTRPSFQGGLEKLAREEGRSSASVRRMAARYLKEIAARPTTRWIDAFAMLCRASSTRGYESLNYDRGALAKIRELAQNHPIVFLPTHKSNIDHFAMFRVLHEDGMPPSHTAGGINMNFFPLGPIGRRSGVFFIRRTFADNELYKFVLRSYIDFLVEKRFPLEWYIEGGRSRSGKLLPPKYGMLSYVVDSYWRGKSEDVILVPVSIAYDQISEVTDYSHEDRGGVKQAENAVWFMQYLARLNRHYGNIDLRFGAPVSLRESLGAPGGGEHPLEDLAVPKLAFEVCARINRVTPITPISLGMVALLGRGDRAMSVAEILVALGNLQKFVERRGLPTTKKLQFGDADDVAETLDPLVDTGVLMRFDEGPEVLYAIAEGQHLAAAYYRNTMIHFLLLGAIVELAIVRAYEEGEGDALNVFWREANALRDLMKFDFFFSERDTFVAEVEAEAALTSATWRTELEDPTTARALLEKIRPFQAHRTLRAFADAYQIVADRLSMLAGEPVTDSGALLRDCMSWGKQYTLQRRIRSPESVSRVLLQNGIKLAQNRGLFDGEPDVLEKDRQTFVEELRGVIRRIRVIDALARHRMAGALK